MKTLKAIKTKIVSFFGDYTETSNVDILKGRIRELEKNKVGDGFHSSYFEFKGDKATENLDWLLKSLHLDTIKDKDCKLSVQSNMEHNEITWTKTGETRQPTSKTRKFYIEFTCRD